MEKTREQIADMVKNMRFERKKPVGKKTKAVYSELQNKLGSIKNDLSKLSLRLWHAEYKSDYHSLSLSEAEGILEEIQKDIDTILKENF